MSKLNTRIEHERVRQAGRSGRARKEFIDAARKIVLECDEGRAASSCMSELKRVLAHLDERAGKGAR